MALIHRVNASYYLLSTIYCKCTINNRRLKSNRSTRKKLEIQNPQTTSTSDNCQSQNIFNSFYEMLKKRNAEAAKSVLITIDTSTANDIHRFYSQYVNIKNLFYYGGIAGKKFVLMECHERDEVKQINNMAAKKQAHRHEYLYSVSPIIYFKSYDKKESSYKHNYHPYTLFQSPSENEIIDILQEIDSASDQITCVYNTLKLTELNLRLRFYTAYQLSYYFSKLFLNLNIVPFGSSVNGFGQRGCDLDLLCYSQSSSYNNLHKYQFSYLSQHICIGERYEQKEFLESMSSLMKICIPGITDMKKILDARVPIIKFYNIFTNMQCDLSSTNLIALDMSEMLYLYGEFDERVNPLVSVIRKWARNMCVTKEISGQWITNFSLTLLIIFYLQSKSILPPMKEVLQIRKYYGNSMTACKARFKNWQMSKQCNNTTNDLFSLLYGFFEYYYLFDFKSNAICIREGQKKSKKDKSPLFIFNPFDESLNVSKNVTISEMTRLIDQFQKALNIMLQSNEKDVIINLIARQSDSMLLNKFSKDVDTNIVNKPDNKIECINNKLFVNEKGISDSKEAKNYVIKS